jgi:hypothetical protein
MVSSKALQAEATSRDLFGTAHSAQPARVRLYADEIKPRKNRLGQWWMYIGLLAMPEDCHAAALERLQDARREAAYHSEIHFKELKNRSGTLHGGKTAVARRWIDTVLWDDQKMLHFHLLGLNLSNLQPSAFGRGSEGRRNIYNRFFRTALASALKQFFGSRTPIRVCHLFHDKGDMENDGLFDWHAMWRLSSAEGEITFDTDRIRFIDSDHEKEASYPDDSHFIQLTDVLAGAMAHCLDASNKKPGCCEIAQRLMPLMERLTDPKRARNPNSRFRHLRRISVAFFPSKKLSPRQLEDVVQRARSGFYIERPLLLQQRSSGQLSLAL